MYKIKRKKKFRLCHNKTMKYFSFFVVSAVSTLNQINQQCFIFNLLFLGAVKLLSLNMLR